MRIAVTGGSGHIGRLVCRVLGADGHEVVCLDRVAPATDQAFVQVDLGDGPASRAALKGFACIVHLAAIPNPYKDAAETVMAVNTASTLNVFEAAKAHGIQRVVYACSESATGFGIHYTDLKPLYTPVDEGHPCWPHETYSLSKYFGELIGENYARAYGLQVLSLRYTWVWFEHEQEGYRSILEAKRTAGCPENPWFGAYISVMDVARAVRAAVACESPEPGLFEAFLLTARDTFYGCPTLTVLETVYAGAPPPVRDPAYFAANPYASVFDIRKAQRVLGWAPRDLVDDLAHWDWSAGTG